MQVNFSILPLNPFKKEKTNQVKYTFLKQKAVWIFSEVNTSQELQCNKLIIGFMHYNFDFGKGFNPPQCYFRPSDQISICISQFDKQQ